MEAAVSDVEALGFLIGGLVIGVSVATLVFTLVLGTYLKLRKPL